MLLKFYVTTRTAAAKICCKGHRTRVSGNRIQRAHKSI